jgi:hypothetical protein
MARVAKRNLNRCPTHPGALLREDVIPATGKTKVEIARLLGISRQHLYDILRERKPVSPELAIGALSSSKMRDRSPSLPSATAERFTTEKEAS